MLKRPFYWVVFAVYSLGAAVSAAPPLVYDAMTDRAVRPLPPLPKLGPAGTVISDPTFKSRILRVTDVDTVPDSAGTPFYTPAASFTNTWNIDSTIFFIRAHFGTVPFSFDPANLRAKRMGSRRDDTGGLVLRLAGAVFSYRDPNIIYGMGTGDDARSILQYNFKTRKYTRLLDLEKVVRRLDGGVTQLSVSDDDDKFSVAFGAIQDRHPYIIVWERSAGKHSLLNTADSTVDGKPTSTSVKGHGIHASYIDRTGRYVIFDSYVWDVAAGDVAKIPNRNSGHEASGFGWRINQSGYEQDAVSDCMGFALRALDLKRLGNTKQLIEPPLKPGRWGTDGHWSWNNARSDVFTPFIGSTYRQTSAKDQPWRPWEGEILGIRTDGKESTVWRFAHHRSIYDGTNFWDTPRGNVSQDGRFFIFTSNWEKTLGTDSKERKARTDVFIVELRGIPKRGSSE